MFIGIEFFYACFATGTLKLQSLFDEIWQYELITF